MRELKQRKILLNLELDDLAAEDPEVDYMKELVRRAGHTWQLEIVETYLQEKLEDECYRKLYKY